jgi:recombination protein RecR
MELSSKLLQDAVDNVSQLPGIGKRTALRLVLHLLNQPEKNTSDLSSSLQKLREEIKYCSICKNLSDSDICSICSDPKRDVSLICVVEDIRDVMAIENTSIYKGLYHVLGGKISPIDGVGPHHLHIQSLVERVKKDTPNELIFALSSTIEGDTTVFYIVKQLDLSTIKVSTIARGLAVGDELQYADEVTLSRSLLNRIPYENSIK